MRSRRSLWQGCVITPSLGTCPVTEESLKEMKSKHPEAMRPVLPAGPIPDLVRKKVDGFPAGSAAGASGTRPQFLKDIWRVPTKLLELTRC